MTNSYEGQVFVQMVARMEALVAKQERCLICPLDVGISNLLVKRFMTSNVIC